MLAQRFLVLAGGDEPSTLPGVLPHELANAVHADNPNTGRLRIVVRNLRMNPRTARLERFRSSYEYAFRADG